jgi:hypothetical protein
MAITHAGSRIVTAETRKEMKKILGEVQSGEFAKAWICENKTGRKNFPRDARGGTDAADREGRRGVASHDDIPEKEKGDRSPGRPVVFCLSPVRCPLFMKVFTFDTTLRDGTQGEAVSFSAEDKVLIAHKLDELGIDYIEGRLAGVESEGQGILHARQGSEAQALAIGRLRRDALREEHRRERSQCASDSRSRYARCFNFRKELEAARRARAGITEGRKSHADRRHGSLSQANAKKWSTMPSIFSTASKADRGFALRTLEAAQKAGTDVLVLCDTNGGTMTSQLSEICAEVRKHFDGGFRNSHA